MKHIYTAEYFDELDRPSYLSALFFAEKIMPLFRPTSVLDFGCGNGSWLRAFQEKGVEILRGLDGPWNNGEMLLSAGIEFTQIDFTEIGASTTKAQQVKADLAICVEVAEHIDEKYSDSLLSFLTAASDVIIFSAAFSNQGGEHHVNENYHSYWAGKFAKLNYEVFDLFRPEFWNNQVIGFWYRQNCFLYVRADSIARDLLQSKGIEPLRQIHFMDCVHPELFHLKCGDGMSFDQVIRQISPSLARAVKRRVKRVINKLSG